MLTKEKVIKNLQDLPDKFSYDELMDRLFILYKIETGQEQSKNNDVVPDDELDEKLEEWLK